MPNYCIPKKKVFPKNTSVGKSRYMEKTRKKMMYQRKKSQKYRLRYSLWNDIYTEDMEFRKYIKKKKEDNLPSFNCESKYIREQLFPTLIPAFRRMCLITLKHCAYCREVVFFDFLDYLAEIIWNTSDKHPERRSSWKSIYCVNENSPFYKSRPCYNYRLFLTPDEAATIIQTRVRGYQTRLKYNLEVLKIEKAKIMEAAGKQKECFHTYEDIIVNIRNCVTEDSKRGLPRVSKIVSEF